MRTRIAYPLAACLALALVGRMWLHVDAVNAADEREPQFEDNFESLDSAWGEGEDYGVKDGKFFIELPPDHWRSVLNMSNVFNEIDATVSVTFVKLEDQKDLLAGLAFWVKDYSSYYSFAVDTNGRYSVGRYANNRWLTVIEWKPNDAIKKGLGQANELRIVTKGHTATLYVNGVQLANFKGQPPEGGGAVGLMADSYSTRPTRIEFAKLKVM